MLKKYTLPQSISALPQSMSYTTSINVIHYLNQCHTLLQNLEKKCCCWTSEFVHKSFRTYEEIRICSRDTSYLTGLKFLLHYHHFFLSFLSLFLSSSFSLFVCLLILSLFYIFSFNYSSCFLFFFFLFNISISFSSYLSYLVF